MAAPPASSSASNPADGEGGAVTAGPCSGKVSTRTVIVILVLSNLLALQLGSVVRRYPSMSAAGAGAAGVRRGSTAVATVARTAASASDGGLRRSGLELPQGEALALPSVQIDKPEEEVVRKQYGGKGDKKHLGGFTEIDLHGVSPAVWKDMVEYLGIRSILDVGCGRGISTSWFVLHGLETLCVEGSHDAVERTIIPEKGVVTEHDFSRGPWWPPRTVDAVWSVEFLEHVGRNYHQNYIPAFRMAALIFVTSSRWGGWHHVEIHPDEWWIAKMESYGFVYSQFLTERVKKVCAMEHGKPAPVSWEYGDKLGAQHIRMSMKVFINPAVASLPEHQHLFSEHGCYKGKDKDDQLSVPPHIVNKPCGTGKEGDKETVMPPEYLPLKLDDKMDKEWDDLLKMTVKQPKEK